MGAGVIGLLRHELSVVSDVPSGSLDPDGEDRGHVATVATVVGTYRGLIQPKSARERASVVGSDASVGTHRIYLEAGALELPVTTDMRIAKSGAPDPDLNGVYRIFFVGNAAGFGHHVEIDAERIDA